MPSTKKSARPLRAARCFQWLRNGDFAALQPWVLAQARRACTRNRHLVEIPRDQVEDVASQGLVVLMKQGQAISSRILANNPHLSPTSEELDHLLTRYVRVSLGHWWLRVVEKDSPLDLVPLEELNEVVDPSTSRTPAEVVFQELLEVLGRVKEEVGRTRRMDPKLLDQSLSDLADLGAGRTDMHALVSRELAAGAAGSRNQVRDRILRRHCRVREALRDSAARMPADSGEVVMCIANQVFVRRRPSAR